MAGTTLHTTSIDVEPLDQRLAAERLDEPAVSRPSTNVQDDGAAEVQDRVYFHVSDITREAIPAPATGNGHAGDSSPSRPNAYSHYHLNHDLNNPENARKALFHQYVASPSIVLKAPATYSGYECRRTGNCKWSETKFPAVEESNATRRQRQLTQEGEGRPDGLTPAARKNFLVLDLDGSGWKSKISQTFCDEITSECTFDALRPGTDQLRSMPHSKRVWTMVLMSGDASIYLRHANNPLKDDLLWFVRNGGSVMFLSSFRFPKEHDKETDDRLHPVWRSFGLPWCNHQGHYRSPMGPVRNNMNKNSVRVLTGLALHQVPEEHRDIENRYVCAGRQSLNGTPRGFDGQNYEASATPFALAQVGKGWVGYFGLDFGYAWEDEMYLTIKRVCELNEYSPTRSNGQEM